MAGSCPRAKHRRPLAGRDGPCWPQGRSCSRARDRPTAACSGQHTAERPRVHLDPGPVDLPERAAHAVVLHVEDGQRPARARVAHRCAQHRCRLPWRRAPVVSLAATSSESWTITGTPPRTASRMRVELTPGTDQPLSHAATSLAERPRDAIARKRSGSCLSTTSSRAFSAPKPSADASKDRRSASSSGPPSSSASSASSRAAKSA